MNNIIRNIFLACSIESDELEKLERFLFAMCEARLFSDTEMCSLLPFIPVIYGLVDNSFSGSCREIARAGFESFIENLNTNLNINLAIKSNKLPSPKFPIVCMSIHNNPAAQDFLIKNLQVLADSGYGHILVENKKENFQLVKTLPSFIRGKSSLLTGLSKIYGAIPEKDAKELQEFFSSSTSLRSQLLTGALHEPELSEEDTSDSISRQELYVALAKDLYLWEEVDSHPVLQLHFSEHYSNSRSSSEAVRDAGVHNKYIMELRNIGFVLELALASFSGSERVGSGALLLVGARHANRISKLYKQMFFDLPQPYFIYPCVLSPSYKHSSIYTNTRDIQQRLLFLAENRGLDRYFRLDFSSRELDVACNGLFSSLLNGDIDAALVLHEFIQTKGEDVFLKRRSIRPISLLADSFCGDKLICRRSVSSFNLKDAISLMLLGTKDLLKCYGSGKDGNFSLSFRFQCGRSILVQNLNLGPILFAKSRYPMYKKVLLSEDHYNDPKAYSLVVYRHRR